MVYTGAFVNENCPKTLKRSAGRIVGKRVDELSVTVVRGLRLLPVPTSVSSTSACGPQSKGKINKKKHNAK